jgi:hypothetical protein
VYDIWGSNAGSALVLRQGAKTKGIEFNQSLNVRNVLQDYICG